MVSRLRYSTIYLARETKTPKSNELKNLVKKTILSFGLCLPLLQCNPLIIKSPKDLVQSQKDCSVLVHESGAALVYNKSGKTLEAELDIPEGIVLKKPEVVCQDERTVIITKEYVGRALGNSDLSAGNEMLGMLGGEFFYQNVIFFSLEPLGKIHSASVKENIVFVTVKDGRKYRIDVDKPAEPAKLVDPADSG